MSAASLLQSTNTPTVTWEPLFKSPTPVPTRSYACPAELPAAWGTVTPEAWWNMQCGNCMLTLTPQPTQIPSLTPTGTPPTPNASATPAAGSGPFMHLRYDLASALVTNSNTFHAVLDASGIDETAVGVVVTLTRGSGVPGVNYNGHISFDGTNWQNINGWIQSSPSTHLIYLSQAMPNPPYPGLVTIADDEIEFDAYYAGDIFGWQNYTGWHSITNSTMNNSNGTFDVWFSSQFGGGTYTANIYAVAYVGEQQPIGTPTPAADFCAVVNDGQVQNPDGSIDVGVDLPQITLGPESCTTFPGLIVNLPVIGEFGVPAVSICVQALSLGVFNILGVAIDMDFLAFVMGASLILRWILRS